MPRLIATDLDGTLLGADYTVSRRAADVLHRAAAGGTAIVLVTGRPVRWLPIVYEQLHGAYPAVCANGAVVYEPSTDAITDLIELTPAVLGEVCHRLRGAIPDVVFAVEVNGGRTLRYEPDWPLSYDADDPGVLPGSLADLIGAPAVKLLARGERRNPDDFTALVASIVDGLVEVTHSSSTGLVEISAAGVTKGSGLSTMAQRLGVDPADALAFGDMPNDVPMLRWAGRSVAVGNAHPAAGAVATDRTLSNVDDGVAVYLERLLDAHP